MRNKHPKTHGHIAVCDKCARETAPESVPPMMAMPPTATESRVAVSTPPGMPVYIVVMDRGGIFGAWLEGARAIEAARNIEGVVCSVPIMADFRKPPDR